MYSARCTEDGVVYAAVDFARLPPEELARKRQLLQCSEFGGPAFFIKASRGGGISKKQSLLRSGYS